MSIEVTDAQSAAVAKSPSTRVSLADIEAEIAFETSRVGTTLVTAGDARNNAEAFNALSLLTIHVLVMRNGFVIIGKSAPADAQNYNKELGAKFAREDAIRQVWPLMGYALRNKLMETN